MGKYIIEVGDAYAEYICGKGDMLCLPVRINEFEDNWLNTNIPLTPYTELDTEKVREEAYEDGYKTAKVQCNIQAEKDMREVGERHYQKGLSDAWEAARKLWEIDISTLHKIFYKETRMDCYMYYTATEAIAKFKEYEDEDKQKEIKIGNEVKAFEKKPFIVTGFGYGDDEEDVYCHGFVTENGISTSAKKNSCVRTGRHFPEIAAIFEKMRGEPNAQIDT